jgi:hypothetical protein
MNNDILEIPLWIWRLPFTAKIIPPKANHMGAVCPSERNGPK